ncbi:hypothetical protein HBH71_005110 [Parastagonospora nodorum]|nr:hypothetical protein HBH71_005110 [Parastagonospora nodorum]KAH5371455.1 hypothetical protein HBI48_035700 [Parastagonospora nodorum]KAH5437754.1 hypothetical protein HBI32_030690 [Parastagonospora nodorum]KAH6545691.1 hypothetical protein HBI07_078840 [Parastagonospora nodorum]
MAPPSHSPAASITPAETLSRFKSVPSLAFPSPSLLTATDIFDNRLHIALHHHSLLHRNNLQRLRMLAEEYFRDSNTQPNCISRIYLHLPLHLHLFPFRSHYPLPPVPEDKPPLQPLLRAPLPPKLDAVHNRPSPRRHTLHFIPTHGILRIYRCRGRDASSEDSRAVATQLHNGLVDQADARKGV